MGSMRRSEGNLKISFSSGDNLIVVHFMPPIGREDKHSICFPFAPPPSRRRSPSLRRYTGVIWGEKLREAVYNLLLGTGYKSLRWKVDPGLPQEFQEKHECMTIQKKNTVRITLASLAGASWIIS